MTGRYEVPDQQGDPCVLDVLLRFTDGSEDGFGFAYGSESMGPPGEIVDVVVRAVEATEPWYQQQKAIAKARR
jgi:hypothetical protein